MLTVLDYCKLVEFAVRNAKPSNFTTTTPDHRRWFFDAGKSLQAVMLAREGNDDSAMQLASDLAELYCVEFERACQTFSRAA